MRYVLVLENQRVVGRINENGRCAGLNVREQTLNPEHRNQQAEARLLAVWCQEVLRSVQASECTMLPSL